MAAKKRQKRKGVPPFLNMDESVSTAADIYKRAGAHPIAHEDLATIFGNAQTSSNFILKLAALRAYGVLAKVDDNASKLTEVAMRLCSATTEDAERSARLEIFRNLPPFTALHDAYAGQVLPEKKYLINILEKQGDISSDFYDEWTKRFESEGRFAGIIYNDPKQRVAVRRTAGPSPINGKSEHSGNGDEDEKPLFQPPSFQRRDAPKEQEFKIPTPSGLIRLYVPEPCAAEDIEIARGLLDLIVKRMTKEPRNE